MSTQMNSSMIAVAIGATVAIITTAASIIYNKIQQHKEEREHMVMQDTLSRLHKRVADLQAEVESLTELQKQQKNRRKNRRRFPTNDSNHTVTEFDTDIDTYSTADTDIGDDEFYDCSDIDDDTDTVNGVLGTLKNLTSILANIDEISEVPSQRQEIYNILKNLVDKDPNSVEVVWRFARACYNCSADETDTEKKKCYLKEGITACERVIHNCHTALYKWYAILIGSQSQFLPVKEKIAGGYRYKEYVEKALELEQTDSSLHHLLGRFKYEVSELSWFERKMASALFAEPPSATYDDALKHFEDAQKFSTKPDIENKLFLGKCCIALSKHSEAYNYLKEVSEITANSEKEMQMQLEAELLLNKC